MDNYRVMLQLAASPTIVIRHFLSSLTIVIYDCKMFIEQATGVNIIFIVANERVNKLGCFSMAGLSSLF